MAGSGLDHQFKTKWEGKRPSLASFKETLILFSQRQTEKTGLNCKSSRTSEAKFSVPLSP